MKKMDRKISYSLAFVFLVISSLACNSLLPARSSTESPDVDQPLTTTQEPAATVERPIPSTEEPAETQPVASPIPAVSCPDAGVGMTVYTSEWNGFCFTFPAYFTPTLQTEGNSETIVLQGPRQAPQPKLQEYASVRLEVSYNGPADGLDSAGYAGKWTEYFGPFENLEQELVSVAGLPALQVKHLPGFTRQLGIFVIANGIKYRIAVSPEPGEVPELDEHVLRVWEEVTRSIVFMPPTNDRQVIRPEDVCPQENADARLFTRLVDGYCLLYPADFEPGPDFPGNFVGGPVVGNFEGFGDIRTSITVGTYGSFAGQTPRQILEPRLSMVDPASVQEVTIGGYPAMIFVDPRDPWPSKQAMIVVQGFAYTVLAQPLDANRFPLAAEPLDRAWNTVISSLAFFDKWR